MKASDDRAVKRTISLPKWLLAQALDRSAAESRTFSNYIRKLISNDVLADGPVEACDQTEEEPCRQED